MWDNRVWLVEHGEGGKEGERDVLGATSRASWKRRQGATWRASWKRWQGATWRASWKRRQAPINSVLQPSQAAVISPRD